MNAKDYLESYAALKMEVRMNEERIFEVFNETHIPAMAPGDGSSRTPAKDRQEKSIIRYIATKDRLQPIIDANKSKMRKIEAAIDRLKDPLHREVLRIRYTDTTGWRPLKWRDVAMRMYGDDEEKDLHHVQRLHREALRSFADIFVQLDLNPKDS